MSVLTAEQFMDRVLEEARTAAVEEIRNNHENLTPELVHDYAKQIVKTVGLQNHTAVVNQRIGKVKSTEGVQKYLGRGNQPCSAQAINDRVRKHNLLRLKNKSGRNAFPVFQFVDGEVHPRIRQLLHVLLGAEMSEWGVAFWLTEPLDFVEGKSAVEVLDDDEAFALVLRRAEQDAADRRAMR